MQNQMAMKSALSKIIKQLQMLEDGNLKGKLAKLASGEQLPDDEGSPLTQDPKANAMLALAEKLEGEPNGEPDGDMEESMNGNSSLDHMGDEMPPEEGNSPDDPPNEFDEEGAPPRAIFKDRSMSKKPPLSFDDSPAPQSSMMKEMPTKRGRGRPRR